MNKAFDKHRLAKTVARSINHIQTPLTQFPQLSPEKNISKEYRRLIKTAASNMEDIVEQIRRAVKRTRTPKNTNDFYNNEAT